jgi:hypothetical protein
LLLCPCGNAPDHRSGADAHEENQMRRLAIIIPVLMLAGEASAISRYQTNSMSCARIQAAVASDGEAILRYPAPDNPSLQLYDRYVRDGRYCSSSQRADLKSVPAADTNRCQVRKCERARGAGGSR